MTRHELATQLFLALGDNPGTYNIGRAIGHTLAKEVCRCGAKECQRYDSTHRHAEHARIGRA